MLIKFGQNRLYLDLREIAFVIFNWEAEPPIAHISIKGDTQEENAVTVTGSECLQLARVLDTFSKTADQFITGINQHKEGQKELQQIFQDVSEELYLRSVQVDKKGH